MFAFIKGKLSSATPIHIVVEVQGVGYRIFIPANVFSKLPQIHQEVLLHTSYVVRELSQTLYGFLVQQECELFEQLMGVTGIGPKLALNIIGHLPLQELQQAVTNHDLKSLSKVPGIGKKSAERLIIELRDKLSAISPVATDLAPRFPDDPRTQTIRDAMSTLINLGYNQMIAQKAIKKTLKDYPEEIDLPTLITISLKNV